MFALCRLFSLLYFATDCNLQVPSAMSSPLECIACFKAISRDGRFMTCAECRHPYHLGQNCAGICNSTFTTMGAAKREKWRCRTCRSIEPRGNPSVSSQEDASGVLLQLSNLNEKIDMLMSIKGSMESLANLPGKVDELMALKPAVERLQNVVGEVQAAIEFLSSKYDTVLQTVSENAKMIKELQVETAALRATASEQSLTITQLRAEANDVEQYSRLSNMEISGLPLTPNENLLERVGELAGNLGLTDFHASDILAIHRLPSRNNSTPVVLIKFVSVRIRDRWLNTRAKLRSLVQSGGIPKLFFNENLTRANKELFWLARERGRARNYKFVWIRSGKIYAKKLESASLVKITRSTDLDKIV